MTAQDMEAQCLAAIENGQRLTLTTDRGHRMPQGFPNGEFLSENAIATNRAYKPEKVLRWLRDRMLIEAVSETAPSKQN
jgi:hypothetical protein